MICPSCHHENLEGTDICEECQAPLYHQDNRASDPDGHRIHDAVEFVTVRETIVVSPNTSVNEAIATMKKIDSGCVLVVDGEKLVGIFTERDVLQRIAGQIEDLDERQISEFMTPSPEALKRDDSIAYVLNKMAMGSFRHVPIELPDGSHTMLSVRDILNYLF